MKNSKIVRDFIRDYLNIIRNQRVVDSNYVFCDKIIRNKYNNKRKSMGGK